jgi:hypothetical protein
VLKSPGGCSEDCGCGEGEEGISWSGRPGLCVPAFVPVKIFLTVTLLEPALSSVLSSNPLVVSSDCTATESTAMAVSLPPAVAVAVNPATQTSGPIVVVSPDAPFQVIYCSLNMVTSPARSSCAHRHHSLNSCRSHRGGRR